MKQRSIGDISVGSIGLGGMPMSIEGRPDRERSIATIHAALDAGVSAATVSEMVTRLVREGLLQVDPESRQLNLTDQGRNAAERTFRRHALSEWLLTEVIGLGWAEADEEAPDEADSLPWKPESS